MTIAFYEHPFSSYVQNAYEKGILFESNGHEESDNALRDLTRPARY
jgi:hypothetical protein